MTPLDRLLAENEIERLVKRFALLNDEADWSAVAAMFVDVPPTSITIASVTPVYRSAPATDADGPE